MAKRLVERQSGQFLVNSQTNPKEHCNNVVSQKEEKDEIERERDEKEREKKRSEGETKLKIRREVFLKKIYHTLMTLQKKKRK